MKQLISLGVQDYLEIAIRRRWFIIVPFLLITIGGVFWSYRIPPAYRASTLILIQKQRVPENYIKPTVTSGIEERLHTISQQIMSRTRLEAIINELNLYPELRKALFMEEVVETMRKDISLEVKGKEAFQLFYQGRHPQLVAAVANRLASFFIDENLKMRQDLAEGTTEFLDRELTRVKKQLEEQEHSLRAFKELNMGALPEQQDANLRTLEQLQIQFQTVTSSLQNAQERKISLQNQMSALANLGSQLQTDLVEIDTAETDPSLQNLHEMLARLLTRYTEKHPDVIRLKRQIAKLEEELQNQEAIMEESITEEASPAPSAPLTFGDTMSLELASSDAEIRRLREDQEAIKAKIDVYRRRIEDTPRKEQELLSLQRDYVNTQKNYESLLDKRLNAQIAANMEKMQKGERFQILDPAQTPQKPFRPDRPRIFLLSLFLGLGCGFALAFGVEFLDHSFRDIDDLERFIDLPVLASIPKIITEEDRKKINLQRKVLLIASLSAVALLIVLGIIHFFFFL